MTHMADPALLARIGLRPGETVRFRRHEGARWALGRLAGVAADGSITLHDGDGSARSLRPERIQVQRPGKRGRLMWRDLVDVATTWEQMELF
jgi:hypothetical protein